MKIYLKTNGKSSGTKNTIDYAISEDKYFGNISPDGNIELTELGKIMLRIED